MVKTRFPVSSTYVRVGHWINGVLYAPEDERVTSRVAVMVMHSDADYLTFPAGMALAAHGHRVLCANVSRAQETLDKKLLDVKQCVEYLRSLPGVERVLLLGHSGGATLMSCYQAVAENGPSYFRGPEKIVPMGEMEELPAADGVLLIDSNWGNGAMTLLSLDPAVRERTNGVDLDPAFDLMDPANGYDPGGSHYAPEFVKRYQKAQGARNERMIDEALKRLEAINAGRGTFRDDEPWIAAGASQIAPCNRLFPQDTRYLSRTKNAWPLIHPDGSITVGVVPCLRKPRRLMPVTGMYGFGGMAMSVRQYLSGSAVRTTEDFGYDETHIYGVDWDSCYCCTPGNVKGIHAPTLIMGMTGSYEFLAAELIYENSPAQDKSIAFVEGASHMLTPARECEEYPGQFGDTVRTLFDYVADWIEKRF